MAYDTPSCTVCAASGNKKALLKGSTISAGKMVNSTKGQFITCDIPMAQFIVNMNSQLPATQKFIIHVLDNTHLFVQPHAAEMIRSAISEFRDKISYEKPA